MRLAFALALTIPVGAAAEGFEAAARLGPAWMSEPFECDGSPEEGHGFGAAFEAEAGWRLGRHASVAGFAGYSIIHYEGTCHDMGTFTWDLREHSLDAGARVQVTARGMFVGFGIGADKTLEAGTTTGDPIGTALPTVTRDVHRWLDARRLIEAHGGFTFPKSSSCGGCALQLFGMVTSAGDTTTVRLALGVQF
jgi:hypothetical protein